MKRIGFNIVPALILVFAVMIPQSTKAGGLSTQLGEVVIANLQIGQTYNLRQLANLQLIVTNTGTDSVNLQMDILKPGSSELRQGATAIPDASWITLSQDSFSIGPLEPASADIIITIPGESQYLGRKFQVVIWSHTVGAGSSFMEVGLKSRIIFTTDTIKADVEELVTASSANVNFTLKPEEIHLEDVPQGVIYDVSEEDGIALTITNHGERQQTIWLTSRSIENSVTSLIQGYEDTPDETYLQFSDSEFTLAPESSRTVQMYLKFPVNGEYTGQNYMFIVHAYTIDNDVKTGVYSRLFTDIR